MLEKRIVQWVPFLVIHAVENSEKPVLSLAQKTVQAAAKLLGHDFARVTRTHRGNRIGKRDPALRQFNWLVKFRAFQP